MKSSLVVLALIVVFVGGCAQQQQKQGFVEPTYANGAPVLSSGPTMQMEAKGVCNYTVVKNGVAMGVLSWNVKIKNTATVVAKKLHVEFLDVSGKIIAADDRAICAKPGEWAELNGFSDLPSTEIEKLANSKAYLVIE